MLDFKNWEKVGEDKQTTTLKHKSGHIMTLAHKKLPKLQQEHLKRLKFAEGGEAEKDSSSDAPPAANITINSGAPAAPQSMQSAQPAQVNVPQAPKPQPVLLPDGSMSAPGVAQNAQAGMGLAEKVAEEKGKADATYQQQFLNEQQRVAAEDSKNITDLKGHTDDFANYMKANPINPNAYLESKSAGGRMATGLGLLLGGGAGGLGGGPNMALDFLNKQIDRNIAAQQARSDQQKTVWGAYQNLYGDQNISTNLAKVSMNNMLVHQAEMTAAQLGTPTAQANLLQLKAQKAQENNKLILDSAGSLRSTPNMPHGGAAQSGEQTNESGEPQASNGGGGVFGSQSGNASIPHDQSKEDYYDSHLLKPDAAGKIDNLQYGTPAQRRDYPQALEQFTKQQQVEKQIKQIDDLFPKMKEEATLSGNIAGHVNPHALGVAGAGIGALAGGIAAGAGTFGLGVPAGVGVGTGIGAAAGEGLGHGIKGMSQITGGQKEVQYQTDKAGLSKFIINALGGNATGAEVDNIVEANTPSYMDNEKSYKKKLDNLRKFLLNKSETSLLDKYGATKK